MLAAILGMAVFTACGTGQGDAGGDESGGAGSEGIRIVATIFPAADWTRNILGDNPAGAQLITLMDSGVDPHSFQPNTQDILNVSSCDVFIHVGGESEAWVEDALKEKINPDLIEVNLLKEMGDQAREEESVEGMQEQRGKIDIGFLKDEDEGPELDEHVWLSLRNADVLCGAIEKAIAAADPANASFYKQNLERYRQKLRALDRSYTKTVAAAPLNTLLFGDRFPFRYLTEDYGLKYYAAFAGCEAETEASFETIQFLAAKLDELKLPAVCTIDGSNQKIAKAIIRASKTQNQKILTMDSMQSVTAADAKAGATYLSIMEKNCSALQRALGGR